MADEKGPFYQFENGWLKLHPRCQKCDKIYVMSKLFDDAICPVMSCPYINEIKKKEEDQHA